MLKILSQTYLCISYCYCLHPSAKFHKNVCLDQMLSAFWNVRHLGRCLKDTQPFIYKSWSWEGLLCDAPCLPAVEQSTVIDHKTGPPGLMFTSVLNLAGKQSQREGEEGRSCWVRSTFMLLGEERKKNLRGSDPVLFCQPLPQALQSFLLT